MCVYLHICLFVHAHLCKLIFNLVSKMPLEIKWKRAISHWNQSWLCSGPGTLKDSHWHHKEPANRRSFFPECYLLLPRQHSCSALAAHGIPLRYNNRIRCAGRGAALRDSKCEWSWRDSGAASPAAGVVPSQLQLHGGGCSQQMWWQSTRGIGLAFAHLPRIVPFASVM